MQVVFELSVKIDDAMVFERELKLEDSDKDLIFAALQAALGNIHTTLHKEITRIFKEM